ncbi:histidine kinase dimerization/phosphoacceptor domain -containing protein [Methanosalsum natronophilum]|uniref:histidine kinase dimerization/phosphoacceptor domain -containing protein n=1 Tax=Methanosalsum natronophilum TaxID=768733 RepID=UPI002167E2D3|nr:histidine kinase dimerization/phosphoacceptor domain -containing protein [Methanosalsum natronophilum]MCS3923824.1 PAS domain S-box-containing protein [Methanosalsum natronophilum]
MSLSKLNFVLSCLVVYLLFFSLVSPALASNPINNGVTYQEDEQFFFEMVQKHGTVMLLIDPENGEIVYANEAATQYYGYDDIHNMKIQDINMLTSEEVEVEMKRAETLGLTSFQFQHLLASGEVRDVNVYSSPVELSDNTYLFSIIADVTDQVRAEQQIEDWNNLIILSGIIFSFALLIMVLYLVININRRKRAEGYEQHIKQVLRGISNVNQIVLKEDDPEQLINKACDNLTQKLGYHSLWVALFDDDGNVSTVASSGQSEEFKQFESELLDGNYPACMLKVLDSRNIVNFDDAYQEECAGCPLKSETVKHGSICAPIEYNKKLYGVMAAAIPLEFISNKEEELLFKELADDLAFAFYDIELEKKRIQVEHELRENQKFLYKILDHLPIGVAVNTVGSSVEFEYMNDNFLKFYRITRDELEQGNFWEVVYEDPEYRETIMKQVLDDINTGDPAKMQWSEIPIKRSGQGTFYINARNIPIPNSQKMISTVWDVTKDKKLRELEYNQVLLKEVHHRVKNNLQVIESLLNMQAKNFDDDKVKCAFKDSQNRIRSMSLAHEKLYGSSKPSSVEISSYIETLEKNLLQSYDTGSTQIKFDNDMDEIYIGTDTITPLGLVLTELFTNSLKHAFKDRKNGTIYVKFRQVDDEYLLEISDDGIGVPEDFEIENACSMGLKIVDLLVKQLRGSMELIRYNGTKYIIRFQG